MDYGEKRAFSRRLRETRVRAGLTQKETAERVGAKYGTYIMWEVSSFPVDKQMPMKLARVFGCDPAWLLYGEQEEETTEAVEARLGRIETRLKLIERVLSKQEEADVLREMLDSTTEQLKSTVEMLESTNAALDTALDTLEQRSRAERRAVEDERVALEIETEELHS